MIMRGIKLIKLGNQPIKSYKFIINQNVQVNLVEQAVQGTDLMHIIGDATFKFYLRQTRFFLFCYCAMLVVLL